MHLKKHVLKYQYSGESQAVFNSKVGYYPEEDAEQLIGRVIIDLFFTSNSSFDVCLSTWEVSCHSTPTSEEFIRAKLKHELRLYVARLMSNFRLSLQQIPNIDSNQATSILS